MREKNPPFFFIFLGDAAAIVATSAGGFPRGAAFSVFFFPLTTFFVPNGCAKWQYRVAAPLAHATSAVGLADVGLSFVAVYREDGALVTDLPKIVRRYATGWFFVDVLANVAGVGDTAGVSCAVVAAQRGGRQRGRPSILCGQSRTGGFESKTITFLV